MRVAASADLIDDREYAAPPELVFEAWTKAEHFARHRKLAAIGWSQTAERLVAYLERRTPWDS